MNKVSTGLGAKGRQLIKKPVETELVRRVVATMPRVREDRVTQLEAAIRSGEYNPSAEAIAEAMLMPSPETE